MTSKLFETLKLRSGLEVRNRFFKSAMSEALADKNMNPSDEIYNLYSQWSSEKIGVLISGNVMVDRRYLGEPGNIVLDEKSDINAFKKWASVGNEKNTPILLQLNHPGKQMYKSIKGQPIAPSAIPIQGSNAKAFQTPREMTKSEIEEAINKFVEAGVKAQEAGFLGVQLHAAHGYLINQFLSPADNQRTDEYGGFLENRMRFLVEIYNRLRSKVGDNFTIALKLNALDFKEGGFSFDECKEVVRTMSELGIDLIEISGGNYEAPVFGGEYENGASFASYATVLTELTDTPIVSTGGFRKKKEMENVISSGVSMIGLARPFVLYPDLVRRFENNDNFDIKTPRLSTKIEKLDKALGPIIGVSYYEAQMKRLANNKITKPSTNAWPYLISTIKVHGLSALKPRRTK